MTQKKAIKCPSKSQKRKRPAEIVKLSSADWNRWDPEDALKKMLELHPELSDVVVVGRYKSDGELTILNSVMSREYALYILQKAATILLDEA